MITNKEPAVIFGGLAEVVKAVIPMLIIFGLIHWSPEQVASVMLVVGVCVSFLSVLLTRSQTTPTPIVDDLIRTATNQAPGTSPEIVKTIQAETKP